MRKRREAHAWQICLSLRITGWESRRSRTYRIGVAYCGLRMAESVASNGVQFFEGVEKLLEIWFTRTDGNSKQCDLRNIPR
jgi:hypothetical protein